MVKSTDGGGGSSSSSSVAPFLRKCYDMVDDSTTDSIISWSPSADNSFVILDTTVFSVQLLPKYFKHSNFSSFIRQLNIYGFRKVDADRWEFANDGFVRGQKDLLKNVIRRKNVQSSEQSKHESTSTTYAQEKSGLWKEVDILKGDKQVLAQELIKVRQYQEVTDTKMLHLEDRVQGMEESQQEMLSFLVMVMKNPSLLVQLLQPKEKNTWRKAGEGAKIVEEVTDEGESNSYGLPLVTYQPPSDNNGTAKSNSNDVNDFLRNADMLKFCLDENHVPLIIPDLYDDGAWEKLLLLSPSRKKTKKQENIVKKGKDDLTLEEEEEDGTMELDKSYMLKLISEEMEKPDDFEFGQLTPERSRNLEILTEQMELLASNE
ncbi:Heat stress transcription factor A-8 [Arabidopsis thaliana]|jgi:heat shock transcription factor|uniref:Heat stress transcription factor A-8 n=4 Tax=Arabidopsis TaxID=3701 RepID=HSFA8_ARATH|nr:heat shock transcription factor A8 [Arabidopsis thaliana]Q9S7U5.1 RecName: Full=Heat stress transcription factor A-8; Short=AtHsfA8; AltName: Full=AtHsf-03; AltName: Full=Heat shock factor protein 5; Short=HSF 5; AltName: Full=Heat shock transcription factor 5; Short=HSTF 5 [Arabidopsis thaliana]KAG7650941.1 Heat shock factor (HSF)-type DNA-binding [Arabidopsis thaliana x Arabidopsis arenosa]KAG7658802.1 Heat shock factor (HSF)-type DNA-binding [Arabidopsis suecica]AAG51992.1 putative heat s|eukprot:NP_176964.1 heat shock transcription factor A8 [Arabidopsis thaliana]